MTPARGLVSRSKLRGLFETRSLRPKYWLGVVAVASATMLLGWICLRSPLFAGPLERLSYDLPYAFRGNITTQEICLVTMDEKSASALHQPMGAPWDRRLHAQLIRTLTEAGARAVLFDIVFDTPSPEPAADAEFAEEIRKNRHVFLGGALRSVPGRQVVEEQILPPLAELRKAAAGWGLLTFRPIDPDSGVRRIFEGTEEVPSATWLVARRLGAALPEVGAAGSETRWLNYYAPPGTFRSVGFQEALRPAELAPGIFKDRVVVVGGGRMSLASLDQRKDEFLTPYTRWGQPFAGGLEIHATTLLNLLRGEWLRRLDSHAEAWLVVLFGAAIAIALSAVCVVCPYRSTATAALVIAGVYAGACWGVRQHRVWLNWTVPAFVQVPAALVLTVGSHYLLEKKRRNEIRRAFSLYLSPHMAEEIAEKRFSLKLGGNLIESTMMFTDLEGFASLSERLGDPRQISDVLIAYFNNTTQHVLESRGTILKYIGDSVFAAWGAPAPEEDHAYQAVLGAWKMHQSSQLHVHGHRLVTRIGLNTGTVLAGNLGSTFRFDYTMIGDAVNIASRVEGANKYLGTQILITQSTWEKVRGRFATRLLGSFKVVGRDEPLAIYEVLGIEVTDFVRKTMEVFAKGLEAFRAGNLKDARALMERTCVERGGHDGPAEFYLQEIAELEKSGLPPACDGIVSLKGK